MVTGTSNTYITPLNTQFLGISKTYFNQSLQALAETFASANAKPASDNYKLDEVATTPNEGMLWYNKTSGKMYVNMGSFYDNTDAPHGAFRAVGLSTTIETDLISATLNIGRLEPGELVATVNDTAGAANNRLYVCTMSGSTKTLVDVAAAAVAGSIGVDALDDALGPITMTAFMQG